MTNEQMIKQLLINLGEDADREGLVDTPKRVVKAWKEICVGYSMDPAEILARRFKTTASNMVICRDIEFYSVCEHHLLPFKGKAHIGYLPKEEVVGLSKLPRLVECFGRRLQIQEQMTEQIADAIMEHLNPLGCAVILEAEHLCMKSRGVRNHSSVMVTSALRGEFIHPEVRSEFLSLVKGIT